MDLILFIKAVILGVVEGITEFLPISSTGHLVIVGDFINFKNSVREAYANMFDVVIQLGAILAIVVLYREKIKNTLTNFRGSGLKFWIIILIAFIPSAILGAAFHNKIENILLKPYPVTFAFIFGGFLMIFMENKYRAKDTITDIDNVSPKQALQIGVFQCLSLWPGMSRSASTIMGGWFSGLNNVAAAEFSFFLAIPTMVAASGFVTLKAIVKHKVAFNFNEIIALIIGFLVSFFVALIVVKIFIEFLKKKPMKVFAIYRIVIGILLLILAYTKIITF